MTVPEDHEEARPINKRTVDGKTYTYKYRFGSVDLEAVDEDMIPGNVEMEHLGDCIRWRYGDRVPVYIREEKVTYQEESDQGDADNQAYFALSILSDEGVVSGFRMRG